MSAVPKILTTLKAVWKARGTADACPAAHTKLTNAMSDLSNVKMTL